QFAISDHPDGLRVSVIPLDLSIPAFVETVVATGLDRTRVHTFEFELVFGEGTENDALITTVNGCATRTEISPGSWEDYHRISGGDGTTKTVDSLLFRLAGTAAPALLGGGLLIDEVNLETGPALPSPAAPTAPTDVMVTLAGTS